MMLTSYEIELYLYQLKKTMTSVDGRKFVLKSPGKEDKSPFKQLPQQDLLNSSSNNQ